VLLLLLRLAWHFGLAGWLAYLARRMPEKGHQGP